MHQHCKLFFFFEISFKTDKVDLIRLGTESTSSSRCDLRHTPPDAECGTIPLTSCCRYQCHSFTSQHHQPCPCWLFMSTNSTCQRLRRCWRCAGGRRRCSSPAWNSAGSSPQEHSGSRSERPKKCSPRDVPAYLECANRNRRQLVSAATANLRSHEWEVVESCVYFSANIQRICAEAFCTNLKMPSRTSQWMSGPEGKGF